jgi:hypothetical protein
MFGSLAGFVIMWYRRQIFFWSGTQNISTIWVILSKKNYEQKNKI